MIETLQKPESACPKCGAQMMRITVGMVYKCRKCDPQLFERTQAETFITSLEAYRLADLCREVAAYSTTQGVGDEIDRGLILFRKLREMGYITTRPGYNEGQRIGGNTHGRNRTGYRR